MRAINAKEKKIIKLAFFILVSSVFAFGLVCLFLTSIPELQAIDFVKNYANWISKVALISTVGPAFLKCLSTINNMKKSLKLNEEEIKKYQEEKIQKNLIGKKSQKIIKTKPEEVKIAEDNRIEFYEIKEDGKTCYVIKCKDEKLTKAEIWKSIDKLSTQI